MSATMTDPTFTGRNGDRIKNIGHKNLWFHTKDAPILVRFGKTGDGDYGPYAFFDVMGDMSGSYTYKPGKDAPDTSFWPQMKAQIDAISGQWVSVTAGFDGDAPALVIEDEHGNMPDAPKAAPTQNTVVPTPSTQKQYLEAAVDALDGVTSDAYASLMAECIAAAEKAVQEAETAFTSEDIRAIAVSIFIQRHR